jgi:hypothetical protein
MRRSGAVGLALGIALVIGALLAAGALADEPVFFGKAAVGNTVAPIPFYTVSGPLLIEGKESKQKIECKAGTGSGEVTGATTVAKYVTTFTGCEIAALGMPCEGGQATPGAFVTDDLVGELGAITATLPGLRLKPEKTEPLAQFFCAGGGIAAKYELAGSMIGSLSGTSGGTVQEGKLASSLKLSLSQVGGVQKYTHFLTGPSEQITLWRSLLEEEGRRYESLPIPQPAGVSMSVTLRTPSSQPMLGVTR